MMRASTANRDDKMEDSKTSRKELSPNDLIGVLATATVRVNPFAVLNDCLLYKSPSQRKTYIQILFNIQSKGKVLGNGWVGCL